MPRIEGVGAEGERPRLKDTFRVRLQRLSWLSVRRPLSLQMGDPMMLPGFRGKSLARHPGRLIDNNGGYGLRLEAHGSAAIGEVLVPSYEIMPADKAIYFLLTFLHQTVLHPLTSGSPSLFPFAISAGSSRSFLNCRRERGPCPNPSPDSLSGACRLIQRGPQRRSSSRFPGSA